jgi:2-polyprenyl-3-methyl-5-hydroxy-6-metoxy-1,4-benzoquinol methylase
MALLYRDTDRDWRRIGETEPFWGVLTAPEFRKDSLTPEAVEAFYESGKGYVTWLQGQMDIFCQARFTARKALDFGCGVGRLTHAMTAIAGEVVGVDVAPAMLAKARERGGTDVRFQTGLPDETFDWIHSYIVFQHIPRARGVAILHDLLKRLAPDGFVTLHFTVGRSDLHRGTTRLARLLQWYDNRTHSDGQVTMHDYDIGDLTRTLYAAGISQMTLLPTDHGGHHGVVIIGRKNAKTVVI